ncbi:Polyketide cyclase / dehydrase and lipid transport [Ruegeria halocynthiae]|uniref:Polyketide cyclase / dehydrase and lipid transport n=1 Tax=Ruegeria halocynthiae TaxID=985054 RepID=A0A1H3C5C0_9RHOB|nr:SRPBCC family protein [Ruegeria halocynthiae]SDX49353.1 Polyketide cyclase / dehydrase and lipid transport [Ruegeria halocynthiae]
MQFSAQEDIEVPIATVFTMVSDFERFERMAMRRGIDVRRASGSALPQAGITWETEFRIRGKPRQITIEMIEFDQPLLMRFQSSSKGMNGETVVEFLALSQRRTRLRIETSLGAKTLPARLLLQSLKLGQSRFRRQFQTRLSEFARELEERHLHGV